MLVLGGCTETPVGVQLDDIASVQDVGDAQVAGDVPCAVTCDDSNSCTADNCTNGICVHTPLGAQVCDDGNPCTTGDVCGNGHCVGQVQVNCDDKNVCTMDTCDTKKGCVYGSNDGPACDDGDGCTQNDTCKGGKCGTGAPLTCDDGNACTTDACDVKTGCTFSDNTAACTDGNACTVSDLCGDGKCVAGQSTVCSDDNACTEDKCDAKSGACVFLPNAVTCDDGNALTLGDTCSAGQCVGSPGCGCTVDAECDDKNPCTKDVCTSGCCVAAALSAGVTCTDGNSCTQDDVCDGGSCISGAKLACDDGNVCTDDACLPGIGCSHTPNLAKCDDGVACSSADVCKAGTCTSTLSACSCTTDANCADGNPCTDDACVNGKCASKPSSAGKACEDGNHCTLSDTCSGGTCLPGGLTDCNDDNVCTDDACSPDTGACVHGVNFASCSDGNACTASDTCAGGACKPGAAAFCDDNNACTNDSCDPTATSSGDACQHVPNSATCSDGNACTEGDACLGGICTGSASGACEDGNPCTNDGCTLSPAGGKICAHAALVGPCDDGDACTTGDACAGANCTVTAMSCDDQNACTDDACNALGACQHHANALACSDGNACTTGDLCVDGACTAGVTDGCDDKDACTVDSCDVQTGCAHLAQADGAVCATAQCNGLIHAGAGTCVVGICVPGNQIACDDANVCTDDACEASTGCAHVSNSTACSDGNLCTSGDICGGGVCLPGAPSSCDDGNLCSVDACDPSKGCEHAAATDGTPCANAGCAGVILGFGGACQAGACALTAAPVNCDDGNPCTDDFCSPSSGCSHQANTVGCSDGNPCTADDACALGKCVGGGAPSCSDNNVCTSDSCSPINGCTHAPANDGAGCDDGSVCTGNDTCGGGICLPGASLVCDDKNPCTNDTCNSKSGCAFSNNTAPCDDGSQCTTGDVCAGGKCGAANNPCDDGNPCTTDGCVGGGGCKHTDLADGSSCSVPACTGLVFQGAATCQAGACGSAPTPLGCDDGNACTDDLCNALSGCLHPNNAAACSDGNACTTGDSCASGVCSGSVAMCADGGACAKNIGCSVVDGCQYQALTGTPCSDGNACTLNDTCAAGDCGGGAPVGCDDNNACTSDACDPGKGCVWSALSSGSCSDGNVCTGADACAAGVCLGGTALNCDDQNPCTNDSCDPTAGCKTSNNTANCQDGNKCTAGDVCSGGACQPGAALVCDDGNPCTTDNCDPQDGCSTSKVANGTVCGSGACGGLKFTAAATCTSGQCIAPAAKNCDDGQECTVDACDATAGCSNPSKAWGTACTPANSALLAPFCADALCTGFEVKVGDPGPATQGVLTGIDRNAAGVFASGWDNTASNGALQGDVRSVNQTTLAVSNAGSYGVAKSHMNDYRDVLAVGGVGTNTAAFMIPGASAYVAQPATASPPFTRTFNAVDTFPSSGGETFVFGGGGNNGSQFQSNVGIMPLVGSTLGAISRLMITTSPAQCDVQVPMTVNDIYAASATAVFFAGYVGKNGQAPTQSAVAVWDGNQANGCDGVDFNYAGEIYVNTPTSSVDRLVAISAGLGQGSYRTIHGTSAAHLLVGGTLGTLWSYDNGAWKQQTPIVPGPTAWSTQFDVKSVWLDGSDAWATGEFYGPSGASSNCRQVFVLHGVFDFAASVWTWNQLALPGLVDCGATIANTQANKIWRDASTKAIYVVGAWGGQELVARVKLP